MNKIKIDRDRVIGELNNNIFGVICEHYGKAIYGGITDVEGDKCNFDKGAIDAFKQLNTPIIRWPGGNFSSGYHWEDGVGPSLSRPVRYDLEWQVEESNRFGTDEFIKYCGEVGAEPYICVNAGSGTAEEAAHWVEYCNMKGNSYYAKLRETNGNADPFNIKYWGIGNELYGRGQIGRKDIEDYITCVKEFSRLMKKVDPKISLVVVGFEKSEWNFKLIKEAGEYFDYISVHSYHVGGSGKSYEEIAALPLITAEQLSEMQCSINSASYYVKDRRKKPIEISFDEWNLREWDHERFIEWLTVAYDYNTYNKELTAKESEYVGKDINFTRDEMINSFMEKRKSDNDDDKITMADAIYTSCVIHTMMRMCKCVTMGCFSPALNGKGLFSNIDGNIVLRSSYHAFNLYSNYIGGKVIDAFVKSEGYKIFVNSPAYNTNKFIDVPYIDAIASEDDVKKKLYIAIVNRNKDKAEDCEIFIDGYDTDYMVKHEIASKSFDSFNNKDSPNSVTVIHQKKELYQNGARYCFPAHSVTILEISFI